MRTAKLALLSSALKSFGNDPWDETLTDPETGEPISPVDVIVRATPEECAAAYALDAPEVVA